MTPVLTTSILGLVEGLTEFLPISSSGHLIIARELLRINSESGLTVDAILQLGTILAALVYFRDDVLRLIRTAWGIVMRKRDIPADDRTLLYGILIGTLPALVFGLLLEHAMETIFRSAFLVACTLIIGSLLFIFAERFSARRHNSRTMPTVPQSWWIGVFQTFALVPGISRSGSTISGGLILGLTREAATRFSFLLALPIITGSGLLKLASVLKHPSPDIDRMGLAIGFIISFLAGYATIRWLLRYLKTHSLMAFVWYRVALACAVFAYLALK